MAPLATIATVSAITTVVTRGKLFAGLALAIGRCFLNNLLADFALVDHILDDRCFACFARHDRFDDFWATAIELSLRGRELSRISAGHRTSTVQCQQVAVTGDGDARVNRTWLTKEPTDPVAQPLRAKHSDWRQSRWAIRSALEGFGEVVVANCLLDRPSLTVVMTTG